MLRNLLAFVRELVPPRARRGETDREYLERNYDVVHIDSWGRD